MFIFLVRAVSNQLNKKTSTENVKKSLHFYQCLHLCQYLQYKLLCQANDKTNSVLTRSFPLARPINPSPDQSKYCYQTLFTLKVNNLVQSMVIAMPVQALGAVSQCRMLCMNKCISPTQYRTQPSPEAVYWFPNCLEM